MKDVVGTIVRESMGTRLKLECYAIWGVHSCSVPLGVGETIEHGLIQLGKVMAAEDPGPRNLKDIAEAMRDISARSSACSSEVNLVVLVTEGFELIHNAIQSLERRDARRG